MTPAEARDILTECFLALPDDALANLAYHLKRWTPISCGDDASRYIDGTGGG